MYFIVLTARFSWTYIALFSATKIGVAGGDLYNIFFGFPAINIAFFLSMITNHVKIADTYTLWSEVYSITYLANKQTLCNQHFSINLEIFNFAKFAVLLENDNLIPKLKVASLVDHPTRHRPSSVTVAS